MARSDFMSCHENVWEEVVKQMECIIVVLLVCVNLAYTEIIT